MADRVEEVEEIASVAEEWDALADRTGAGPFVRPGWFEAWLAAFGRGDGARVLCVRRGGRLTGALPVVPGRGARRSPTNWHTPVFGAVVDGDDAAAVLAGALVAKSPSVLDLSFLDPQDALLAGVRARAEARGGWLITRPVLRSPYIDVEGDFGAFERTLDSKLRRETRRRRRKLAERGTLSVEFADGRDDLRTLLDDGFAVEGSGWKSERGTAIVQTPEAERFYRDVAAWAARRGWLQLGFVRLDGRAIAFSYSLVAGGTVHVVKVGFDPAFRPYAPGTILTREAVARAFEQGMRRYDFLGDADPYKLDWTTSVRERVRIQAFGRTGRGVAGFAAWRYGRPTAKKAVATARRRAGRAMG